MFPGDSDCVVLRNHIPIFLPGAGEGKGLGAPIGDNLVASPANGNSAARGNPELLFVVALDPLEHQHLP